MSNQSILFMAGEAARHGMSYGAFIAANSNIKTTINTKPSCKKRKPKAKSDVKC